VAPELKRNETIEVYLKSGLSVIPFEEKEKKPVSWIHNLEWTKKSDVWKIDYFFDNPNLNVGLILCSDLCVVDVDEKENPWLAYQNFQNTLTVSTFKGYHFYFRNDAVVTTSAKILPGIDTRCRGTFIVLPPSIHPSGKAYEWTNIAQPEQLPIEFRREWREREFERYGKSKRFVLSESIPQGNRNDTLWRHGRSLRALGKGYFEIKDELELVNQTRCEPPISSFELETLIDSVWNRPNSPSFTNQIEHSY
jgi:hypothetical protein